MVNTAILILVSLIFVLISWICYKLYISNSTSSDDLSALKEQQGRLSDAFENLIKPITKMGEDVITFKDPMSKISRYLSGGTRAGKFGEWGAEAILRDILPEHLIDTNVEIKSGSGERVEFTVKLPEGFIPIDAKFPSGLYDNYIEAVENDGNVKKAKQDLRRRILSDAKDINDKYILRGITIDLGIMFIPSEAILQLIDTLDDIRSEVFRNSRVLILGPNNLAAYLVTVYAGFQSIALNERAEEILIEFGNFSKEFEKFSGSTEDLENIFKKAQKVIDEHKTRENQMLRSIKRMQSLGVSDD